MIEWWQKSRELRSGYFTHGQRLFANTSRSRPDQIDKAIKALLVKPQTSRAIAVLMDPLNDLATVKTEFPAFVLVQFTKRDSYLDVTAFFRKQEMPHWWPINVGELAHLQHTVVDALRSHLNLSAGAITTVTAMPTNGSAIPRVAVPLLDQKAEEHAGLLDLVLPLFGIGSSSADVLSSWQEVIEDWRPDDKAAADGDRIPRIGLTALCELIDAIGSAVGDSGRMVSLLSTLQDLEDANASYDGRNDRDAAVSRAKWRATLDRKLGVLTRTLHELLKVE